MKVCYVTHLPNLTGSSQSLLDMIECVKKFDVEPYVLLGKKGPLEEELSKRGIKYKIIRYSTDIKEGYMKTVLKKTINFFALPKIKNYFKKEKFDVIHNNSFLVSVGMKAALEAGIPYISHNREMVWEDHRITLTNEEESNTLFSKADARIYISDFVKEKFTKLSSNKYFVIRDAMDMERYLFKHECYISDPNNVRILLAGRIAEGKGQLEAIKAVERINNSCDGFKVKLVIAGNPTKDLTYYNKITSYVAEKKLENIEFHKFRDLREERKRCDIALVCSSNEALGRVTLESMLSGTITIGANAGATRELIKDGENGFLYQCGNEKDLADKIVRVLNMSNDELTAISATAQAYVMENFKPEDYGNKIFNIYKELAE